MPGPPLALVPGARAVERRARVRIELELDPVDELLELCDRSGARDRRRAARAMGQPAQPDLRRRAARRCRDLLDRLEHREASIGHVGLLDAAGAGGFRQIAAAMVLAGEESAAERRVGDDAQRLLETERLELALVLVAEHEVVLRLDGLVAHVRAPVAPPQGG